MADLERLGELDRPEEKSNAEFLDWFCTTRPSIAEAGEDILVWEVDTKAIGYCTLKEVRPGMDAQIHLHIWDTAARGKGYGAILFCLSALEFRKRHALKALYCQPKADNPMPNGMLQRVGFKLLAVVDWKRKDGSVIQQNKYLVDEETARAYLRAHLGVAPEPHVPLS